MMPKTREEVSVEMMSEIGADGCADYLITTYGTNGDGVGQRRGITKRLTPKQARSMAARMLAPWVLPR